MEGRGEGGDGGRLAPALRSARLNWGPEIWVVGAEGPVWGSGVRPRHRGDPGLASSLPVPPCGWGVPASVFRGPRPCLLERRKRWVPMREPVRDPVPQTLPPPPQGPSARPAFSPPRDAGGRALGTSRDFMLGRVLGCWAGAVGALGPDAPASPAPFVSAAPLGLPFLPRLRKTFIRSPRSKSAPSHPLAASRSRGGPPPAVLPSQSPSPRGSESPWVAGCWGECRGGGAAGGGRLRRDGLPAGLRGRAAGPAHRKLLPLPARAPASCQPPPRPERGRDRGAGTARRPEGVALRGPARAACWRM